MLCETCQERPATETWYRGRKSGIGKDKAIDAVKVCGPCAAFAERLVNELGQRSTRMDQQG